MHIDTGRYYAAKVINKRMMAGREHMVNRLGAIVEQCAVLIASFRSGTRSRSSREYPWATRTS